MNEATSAEATPNKLYVVVFRCESRVVAERGKIFVLPPIDVGGGPLTFDLVSEYRSTAKGLLAPAHLLLRTTVSAPSMPDAHLAAAMAAGVITNYLAFAHNAYIEAPMRWYSFELGRSNDWRRIGQMDYESVIPPHIGLPLRIFQHELSCQFINQFVTTFHNERGGRFQRSIGLYNRVLANWDSLRAVYAAQYLFMTIEPLWKMAVPALVIKRGKSKEAIVQEFFEEERGDIPLIPKSVTEQEARAIQQLINRIERKASLDARERRLKNAALQEVVFENAEATFSCLNKAMNGLEHGYDEFHVTMQKVWPLLDEAAVCIRRWLCKEITTDAALLDLLGGDRRLPTMLGKASIMVNAEFRSETIENPIAGPYSPFELAPIPDLAGGAWKVDVASKVLPLVELRILSGQVRFVETTFVAEARAMAPLLKYNWGIEIPPGA